jgi:hypothetical protein
MMRNIIRKLKYSAESVYIFSELKKRDRAVRAMRFHEMKVAVQVALCIFICQMALLGLILLLK